VSYSSDVLIVGAGIGGLSLALRLAAKGYRVRIIQQREPARVYRPEIIQPAGLLAYEELGLLSNLMARRAARVNLFHFHRIGGDRLCRVDYRLLHHPHPYALITLPHQTRRVLMDGLGRYPAVTIHWDAEFRDVLRRGSRVVGVKAVEHDREQEFCAAVTVGSDGSKSRLRDALGIGCRLKRYANGFLSVLVKSIHAHGEDGMPHVRYYLGEGEILGIFPTSSTTLCLLYMVPTLHLDTLNGERLAEVKQRIASIEPWLNGSLNAPGAWERQSRLAPVQARVSSWAVDGAALIGDAAHACHPHIAQGSFQAMEDGRILADVLDGCFAKGDFSARALAPYEETRRPVIERLQRLANEYAWLWETKNPLLVRLRDWVFRNIGNSPRLLYKVAATEAGIDSRPLTVVDRLQALGICA
jgi:2-polyprenyl-6-methoxyphenol hydroxylase-like FAD-dependent oxidoreductase